MLLLLCAEVRAETVPRLAGVVVSGSTVYDSEAMFAVYRNRLGQPLDRETGRQVAADIADLYWRDGYLRPRVTTDESLLARGILRVALSEPRLTAVAIEGNAGPYHQSLRDGTKDLSGQQPISRVQLQRTLQWMRSLPGLSLDARLLPDEVVLEGYYLALSPQFASIDAELRLSNRATEEIGRNVVLARISGNGVFGQPIRVEAVAGAAADHERFRTAQISLEGNLGPLNSRLAVAAARSAFRPARTPTDLHRRERLQLRLRHAPHAFATGDASLDIALELDDLDSVRSGTLLRTDRLRVVELGARLAPGGNDVTKYLIDLRMRKGLDALGSGLYTVAGNDARRSDFLLARLHFVRLQHLTPEWSLRLDLQAQHSSHLLPQVERFRFGGDRIGRGFTGPVIAGERGIGAAAQLRRSLKGAGHLPMDPDVYAFYDQGTAWRRDASARSSAASSGVGISWRGRWFTGQLELARPLAGETPSAGASTRLFAEIQLHY